MAVISHDGNIKYNGIVQRVWSHQIFIKIFTLMVMAIRWKKCPCTVQKCLGAQVDEGLHLRARLIWFETYWENFQVTSKCAITIAKMAISRGAWRVCSELKRSARLKKLLKNQIRPLAKCVNKLKKLIECVLRVCQPSVATNCRSSWRQQKAARGGGGCGSGGRSAHRATTLLIWLKTGRRSSGEGGGVALFSSRALTWWWWLWLLLLLLMMLLLWLLLWALPTTLLAAFSCSRVAVNSGPNEKTLLGVATGV